MKEFNKAVFMSIQPKWCYKIFTGEKVLEIRKTRPKEGAVIFPFEVYVYCTGPSRKSRTRVNAAVTLSSDELFVVPKKGLKYGDSIELMSYDGFSRDNFLNGKCIGRFTVDYIDVINCDSVAPYNMRTLEYVDKQSCLDRSEFLKYCGTKRAYGWHISDYELFGHPFTANDFPTFKRVARPPQSWQYIRIDRNAVEAGKQYISLEEYYQYDKVSDIPKAKGFCFEEDEESAEAVIKVLQEIFELDDAYNRGEVH